MSENIQEEQPELDSYVVIEDGIVANETRVPVFIIEKAEDPSDSLQTLREMLDHPDNDRLTYFIQQLEDYIVDYGTIDQVVELSQLTGKEY